MDYMGYHTPEQPLFDTTKLTRASDPYHKRSQHYDNRGYCFLGYGPLTEQVAWCQEMFPRYPWARRWIDIKLFSGDHVIVFVDKDDAFAFRMRWGGPGARG